jgi:hypothetical protein
MRTGRSESLRWTEREKGRLIEGPVIPYSKCVITSNLHKHHADIQDVAKIVQEKYIDRADGDINFNMIVLAGEPE